MNRFLSILLAFVLISCGSPRYPVLTDPTDPSPVPVNPPVIEPVAPSAEAIAEDKFSPFIAGETRVEEVHYIVGKGKRPDGEVDDMGVLWYFYSIIRKDGKGADAILGFTKNKDGNWILRWKHVGY